MELAATVEETIKEAGPSSIECRCHRGENFSNKCFSTSMTLLSGEACSPLKIAAVVCERSVADYVQSSISNSFHDGVGQPDATTTNDDEGKESVAPAGRDDKLSYETLHQRHATNHGDVCVNDVHLQDEDIIDGFAFQSFANNAQILEFVRRDEKKIKLASSIIEPTPSAKVKKETRRAKKRDKENKTILKMDELTYSDNVVDNTPSKIANQEDTIEEKSNDAIEKKCSSVLPATSITSTYESISIPKSVLSSSATDSNERLTLNRKEIIGFSLINEQHRVMLEEDRVEIVANVDSETAPSDLVENNNEILMDKRLTVKHKLNDNDYDFKSLEQSIVKVPKLNCENDSANIPSSLQNISSSSTNSVAFLAQCSPGNLGAKPAGIFSPKLETSRSSVSGVTFSEGTDVGDASRKSTGCTPVTTSINGVRQSLSSSDLEQRLLIASKGSVFDGLLTPVVSAPAIPQPPQPGSFYHTEMHQHQHTHMHQYPPFLPPFGTSLPVSAQSMFALPSFQGLSGGSQPLSVNPLLNVPPVQNNMQIPPQKKKGRWCAMHVQIAWDIHNKDKAKRDRKSISNALCSENNGESVSRESSRRSSTTSSVSIVTPSIAVSRSNQDSTSISKRNVDSLKEDSEVLVVKSSNGTSSSDRKVNNENTKSTQIHQNNHHHHNHQAHPHRSESHAGVESGKNISALTNKSYKAEKKSSPTAEQSSQPLVSTVATSIQDVTRSDSTTEPVVSTASWIQDGLLYRQREFQKCLEQANSLTTADNLMRSAAAFDMRPQNYPYIAPGTPFSATANGQLVAMSGLSPSTAAALHSQLNLFNNSHLDALRLRGMHGPPAPTFDPFRGFMETTGIGRLPFSNDPAAAMFRPPMDPSSFDRERFQQQQQLFQRLQQQQQLQQATTASAEVQSATSISQASSVGSNPLASLIDSERASSRTSSSSLLTSTPMPQFSMSNGVTPSANMVSAPPSVLPALDSSAMTFYANVLHQQRALEIEQRNRLMGFNSLLSPPTSMAAGGLQANNVDLIRAAMFCGAGAADANFARALAGAEYSPYFSGPGQSNLNFGSPQMPSALNNVLSQGSNKLSPFSLTLQQLARRDSMLNSAAPNNNNLPNR